MGPVWHGGQDIKALVLASRAEAAAKSLGWAAPFPTAAWLRAAEDGAAFSLRTQEMSGGDLGLIHAFENSCCDVQTSTLLEGMHGLITPRQRYGQHHLHRARVTSGGVGAEDDDAVRAGADV